MFEILQVNQLFLKQSKCQFERQSVKYLGHVISRSRVDMDKDKITTILDWPMPSSLKGLRGFLGLTGYYQKLVRGYVQIVAPLSTMLKKNRFHWSREALQAFEQLKQAMITGPSLALLNFSIRFIVECDVSSIGIGAVLMQQGHPIAYYSKALKGKHRLLSVYDRELQALVLAVEKWKSYLMGQKFSIVTGHISLKYLWDSITSPHCSNRNGLLS